MTIVDIIWCQLIIVHYYARFHQCSYIFIHLSDLSQCSEIGMPFENWIAIGAN